MGLSKWREWAWGAKKSKDEPAQIPGVLRENVQMLQSAASRLERAAAKIEREGSRLEIIVRQIRGEKDDSVGPH